MRDVEWTLRHQLTSKPDSIETPTGVSGAETERDVTSDGTVTEPKRTRNKDEVFYGFETKKRKNIKILHKTFVTILYIKCMVF